MNFDNFNFPDRTSLRNLHGNLAENRDSNSQYEIARQILEDEAGMVFTESAIII